MNIKPVLREPLVHFLLAGILLYGVFSVLHPAGSRSESEKDIVVDRQTLLTFMQNRAKAFEPALFSKKFREMAPEDKQALIGDYVREEVLFREASAMGLEQGDYVIRQRMIQKLEFLIEDSISDQPAGARELDKFFAAHQGDYEEPPIYTFTHVFFDAAAHGELQAHRMAMDALRRLNRERIGFNGAMMIGDRFPYFQNYVERTRDFVVSHFGEGMTKQLDGVEPAETIWRGPFKSPYGEHLVLLTRRVPSRLPELSEIEQKVLEDYKREHIESTRRSAVEKLVEKYKIAVLDFGGDDE